MVLNYQDTHSVGNRFAVGAEVRITHYLDTHYRRRQQGFSGEALEAAGYRIDGRDPCRHGEFEGLVLKLDLPVLVQFWAKLEALI